MSIVAEYLRIARACNKQNSFLNPINPLVTHMISHGEKKCRIANVLFNFFQQIKCITEIEKELLAITSF